MNMSVSYDQIEEGILIVLRNRYKLSASEARDAMKFSPIKRIFDANPELTAHISSEAWARDIYKLWKNQK